MLYLFFGTVFILLVLVLGLCPIKTRFYAEWAEQLSKLLLSAQNVDIPDAGPAPAATETAAAPIKPAYPGNAFSY